MKAKAALKSFNLKTFNNLAFSIPHPSRPWRASWIWLWVKAALMKKPLSGH
jgi:hypothetical protein